MTSHKIQTGVRVRLATLRRTIQYVKTPKRINQTIMLWISTMDKPGPWLNGQTNFEPSPHSLI